MITTMLLIVGTAIIGSGLFAWGSANFGIQQANIGAKLSNEANLARAMPVIEDVWFFTNSTSPLNFANVTIRNTGSNGITISSILLNNTNAWSGQIPILSGAVATIAIPDNWGKGKPQTIGVNTNLGASVNGVWIP